MQTPNESTDYKKTSGIFWSFFDSFSDVHERD